MPFIASRLRVHCEPDTAFAQLLLQAGGFQASKESIAEAIKTTAEKFYQTCVVCDTPVLQRKVAPGAYIRKFFQDLATFLTDTVKNASNNNYEIACGILDAAGLAPVLNPNAAHHRAQFFTEMSQGAVPLARWLQCNFS